MRLSKLVHSPIVDSSGTNVGRLDDLIARLGDSGYPLISGAVARVGGRQLFVPANQIADMGSEGVRLSCEHLPSGNFERREGEVLLEHDVANHKVINVDAGRLVRPTDIIIGSEGNSWRVVGVYVDPGRMWGRVFGHGGEHALEESKIIDWSRVEPFVSHVPTAKLRLPLPKLRRLHPAQIADLVEAASHDEGEEIIDSVHGDPELEADVFEELNPEHQVEFLEDKTDADAAAILSEMEPDDAADLITEIPQSRRLSILTRLPKEQQAKIRGLLSYNPQTAGGLMHPDFIAMDQSGLPGQALEKVREADFPVFGVYMVDAGGRFLGSISLRKLLQLPSGSRLEEYAEHVSEAGRARIRADADFTDVALMMTDYNLVALAVVDEDDRLLGVISVDDVLETLIPEDWRRREVG